VFERIERGDVQRLVRAGAQLVEVLSRAKYDGEHIAGARHIRLRTLDDQAPRRLDRTRPVLVYCNGYLCVMSPRQRHGWIISASPKSTATCSAKSTGSPPERLAEGRPPRPVLR
jgi:hypothetical protein